MSTATKKDQIEELIREKCYRRGVHQAIATCRRWIQRCETLDEVNRLLAAAEAEAHRRRYSPRRQDFLLDEIGKQIKAKTT